MTLDLGGVRVDVISDGTFALDGGAMFGVVPKPLWARVHPPDDRNRITLALNCLLIRRDDHCVLVDTGMGHFWTDKERDIFAVRNEPGLLEALRDLGVAPGDVTTVINTHLHFDHAGGNTTEHDGQRVPAFPNAEYVVQQGELKWANEPTRRDRASYRPETFGPVQEAGRFRVVTGEADVLPGIRVRPVPGHTPNIQGILVEGAKDTLFFPSDLVPTAGHIPYPWIMGYDLEPLRTLRSKERTFPEAAEKGWIVVLQHEPKHPVGRIVMDGDRPRFDPAG